MHPPANPIRVHLTSTSDLDMAWTRDGFPGGCTPPLARPTLRRGLRSVEHVQHAFQFVVALRKLVILPCLSL